MSTCWPARCPRQPGTCSIRLLTRGVSTTMSRTLARCQASRRAGAGAASIAVIALLLPGIAVDVIAERFPKARLILVHETQALHPLGTFPEIKVRHEQPGRTSVRRKDRQALVAGRDRGLAADQIGRRKVRRWRNNRWPHSQRTRFPAPLVTAHDEVQVREPVHRVSRNFSQHP